MSQQTSSSSGVGFGSLLFLLFLALKLTNTIDWSWWWVTAPLWGSVVVFVIVAAIYLFFVK
jgi:hypothetical protein